MDIKKDHIQEQVDIIQNVLETETEIVAETEIIAETELVPVDAIVQLHMDDDRMTVYLKATPPENGGSDITREMIDSAINELKVTFGIDEEMLERIIVEKPYHRMLIIAKGLPAIDGQDGRIEDFFSRQQGIQLREREDGTIDFKNLNLITPIEANTVISDIIPPIEPVSGMNVQGAEIKGRNGKAPIVPRGDGTVPSEDGTQLLANYSGNLVFRKGRFFVDKILRIKGNVDNSVGNIDFNGDVVVEGDLLEGYTINAKGSVTIKGAVEGAFINSGGDIVLMKGMSGMNKGSLVAQKNINGTFLENCTAKAGQCIHVESIINSSVNSGDEINVIGKHGTIVGGVCTAFNAVTTKCIGSRAGIPTHIVLGATQEIIHERNSLERQLCELRNEFDNLNKNIKYLELMDKTGKLNAERKALLNQLKTEKPRNQVRQSFITKKVEEINKSINNIESCRVHCEQIFPSSKITIGNSFINITEVFNKCVIYYADNEVKIMHNI